MAQAMLKPCPICKKMATEKHRPFCSPRCADEDLGRWISETYRLPTEETIESDDPLLDDGEA